MPRYCLALDLKDDAALIAEYRAHHARVWPEVLQSIRSAGIQSMEIYLVGNRLLMVMEADDQFSFAAKASADESNPRIRDWEELMWNYQQALPVAKPGEKWVLMERIFSLQEQEQEQDKR